MMLRHTVEVVPADHVGPVHFVGAGGAGMSGIAELYRAVGVPVSGCDRSDSPTLRRLASEGIGTAVGHDVGHLEGIETVVVSSAIGPDNPEIVAAGERGLRIWHRSAALAALMIGQRVVSVAGTHGKTTTSAMLSVMLASAGVDPSFVIGSPLASTGLSSHRGAGRVFVVEADESDGSFLQYPTEIAVVTSVEADHLDNWGTPQHYAAGFRDFATSPGVKAIVVNADEPGARRLAEALQGHESTRGHGGVRVLTYGEAPDADLRLTDLDLQGTRGRATLRAEGQAWPLHLQVPGRYNLANAAAAFGVGRILGLDPQAMLASLGSFTGTLRRFQLVGLVPLAEDPGQPVQIFDDYAHHPTELRAALGAALRARGTGRLVACFQPHLYSRTQDFADEFGAALCLADVVVVTDIYGSREDPVPGVTGALVADAVERHAGAATEVRYVPDKNDLPATLAALVRPGDLVMTLGAGDVTLVGPMLARLLAEGTSA